MSQFKNVAEVSAYAAAVVVFSAIGLMRIVDTYDDVSETQDEATHIAAGLEWLAGDTYESEQGNPPLSRIPIALGVYLDGVQPVPFERRNEVLSTGPSYIRSLHKARAGTLVFFLLAVLVVFGWTLYDFGKVAALLAVLVFTNVPPILAHAGLATTDMAATATVPAAIFGFSLWLRAPTLRHGAIFGVALSLALLAKFSAILFLASAIAAILIVRLLAAIGEDEQSGVDTRGYLRSIPLVFGLAALVFWMGYGFSVGSISSPGTAHPLIDQLVGAAGPAHDLVYRVVELPIYPVPEAAQGLRELFVHNRGGHEAYVLGEVSNTGFWYFFPVALGVKTPIPLLLFVVSGCIAAIGSWRRERSWIGLVPIVSSAAILASVVPANINIGLRHVLPMYPMLSIVAAVGIVGITKSQLWANIAVKLCVGALLVWYVAASWGVHPDYLAYFNELAGPNPEDILVDSDLDWGQDVGRLSEELKSRHIETVSLALFSGADLDNFEWPETTTFFEPTDRPTGWVAVSVLLIKAREYGWLEAHEPVAVVGNSIRLYFIPDRPAEAQP